MGFLTAAAIKYNRVSYFFLLVIIIGGSITYFKQPSQEDPEITVRVAKVITQYPGMSAERIEQLITKPLEEVIKRMPEVSKIKSLSRTGVSDITVTVADPYFDLAPIWTTLRNKINDAKADLPSGTQPPYINDDFGRVSAITLALQGGDFTPGELAQTAEFLRDKFAALALVSTVDLYGVQDEHIWLQMDPIITAQLGINPSQITSAIKSQNIVLPGGRLSAHGLDYFIEPSGNFNSIEDIKNVAIKLPDQVGSIYLQDVVTVRRDYVSPAVKPAFFNGSPAIVMGLSMVSNSNISEFGHQVENKLAQLRPLLPLGMSLDISTNQPPLVKKSVMHATVNLGQTIATVLAVVMLFLGLRTGAIVGIMVPLTILMVLIGMSVWEIPLHRISIAAIIISLGLLIDNAIVIAEDISKRLSEAEDRLSACLNAGRSLSIPLLTSSLTTILAFMPLMLAENASGEFVRALSQVVILSLLSSWFLSLTVTPLLCYHLMKTPDVEAGKNKKTAAIVLHYGRLLQAILKRPGLFVAGMLAVLVISLYSIKMVTPRLMPPSDRAQYVVTLELPAGSNVQATTDVYLRLADWLNDGDINPEIKNHVAYIAHGGPRFFLALPPIDAMPHVAFLVINTDASDMVDRLILKTETFIAEQLPEAQGRAEKLFIGSTKPGTVELRISGDDAQQLTQLGIQLENLFTQVPGIRGLKNDWMNPVVDFKVQIDQDRARLAGITNEQVAWALSAYFDGAKITDYREQDDVIPISLRVDVERKATLDDLRSLIVNIQDEGRPIPLIQIANIHGQLSPYLIRRNNQEKAVTVSAYHPDMQAAELYAAMQDGLEQLKFPYGYRMELDGELRASADANNALLQYFPHCLAGILLLLIMQFNSIRRPAIIMMTIPLVIIGAAFGLILLNGFMDFVAILGLFSLAGIIINNGIVLIDRIELERQTTSNLNEALLQAATARFRPIMMASLTTILGLLPLYLSGGEFWRSMTIVIMFGLAVGTLLTLGFVPALYTLLFRHEAEKQRVGKTLPA
ncbi:MAG: efflux RND transporter permease subunit [Pseudomonadales bacterium]|nr:efflux RND transporter permease subunit [Pseudomonadales bacterium]